MNALLVTDLSAAGLAAIDGALACGVAEFDRITLLHVVDLDLYTAGGSVPQIVDFARKELEPHAEALREAWFSADVRIEQGPVVETIDRVADEIEADLIIMTNVGEGAVTGRLLGSTAERVAASGRMVLVERAHKQGEKWCRMGGGSPFESLVVGVDEPAAAGAIVEPLVELPGVKRVRVVHAATGEPDLALAQAALEAEIAEWPRDVEIEGVAAVGEPAEVLVEQGKTTNASAIAVAPQARGMFRRGVLGSVAHDVLRHADRAVLLVPWTR